MKIKSHLDPELYSKVRRNPRTESANPKAQSNPNPGDLFGLLEGEQFKTKLRFCIEIFLHDLGFE